MYLTYRWDEPCLVQFGKGLALIPPYLHIFEQVLGKDAFRHGLKKLLEKKKVSS
jgi:hypothetical protein